MAYTSLENLRTAVRRLIGQGSSPLTISDDSLDDYVIEAIQVAFMRAAPVHLRDFVKEEIISITPDPGAETDVSEWPFFDNLSDEAMRIVEVSFTKTLLTGDYSDTGVIKGRMVDRLVGREAVEGLYTYYSEIEPIYWFVGGAIDWRPITSYNGSAGVLPPGTVTQHIYATVVVEPDYSDLDTNSKKLDELIHKDVSLAIEHLAAALVFNAMGLYDVGNKETEISDRILERVS